MKKGSSSKIRVMGFGTFDGIHPGHVAFLKQLKALGDEVWVVVARDKNVQKIKGYAPRASERRRQAALRATGLVTRVLLGNLHDFYQCLRDHRPQVIGLGYDQAADLLAIKRHAPGSRVVRLKPFQPKKYKSSLLAKT